MLNLSLDDVFCTSVVLDLTFGCLFSVKFVPMFDTCMLVSDKLDWFEFLIFLSCVSVD